MHFCMRNDEIKMNHHFGGNLISERDFLGIDIELIHSHKIDLKFIFISLDCGLGSYP